jgi:hypothetical protein
VKAACGHAHQRESLVVTLRFGNHPIMPCIGDLTVFGRWPSTKRATRRRRGSSARVDARSSWILTSLDQERSAWFPTAAHHSDLSRRGPGMGPGMVGRCARREGAAPLPCVSPLDELRRMIEIHGCAVRHVPGADASGHLSYTVGLSAYDHHARGRPSVMRHRSARLACLLHPFVER